MASKLISMALTALLLTATAGLHANTTTPSGPDKATCIKFLYDNMSLADSVSYPRSWWEANVDKTLEVKDKMGWNVPEREFMHFVLPVRANNEDLDDFRLVYADTLCARVKGMSMEQAALEINHWCHEMASYRGSDARTSSPMQTVHRGLGRCGEESVLGVAALRAAGIPARQVYTPRWAHSDDNHAWVEVYINGKWWFMGACEPEAKLNMAWFNGPVSRAMILHTKAFGHSYDGPEDVIRRTSAYTEINVTSGYVSTRRSQVEVFDTEGNAVTDAKVEFKIYNYAEFFTVATYTHNPVSLDMGHGDMLAWASKGNRYGVAKISGENTKVVLDHEFGNRASFDFDIVPPVENPIKTGASAEEIAANSARLAQENAIRDARSKENTDLTAFLKEHGGKLSNGEDKAAKLVESLSEKDRGDVTAAVLEDAWGHIGKKFMTWRDCPRIEREQLVPYMKELSTLKLRKAEDVAAWVNANIRVDNNANPQRLRIAPIYVWQSRKADDLSRDIFYVALCRANGIEARIDEVTGKPQFMRRGSWHDAALGGKTNTVVDAPKGTLKLCYDASGAIEDPEYYRHFTLAKIVNGSAQLLNFDENGALKLSQMGIYTLDEGDYLLTSGNRMADGSVLAHMEFFKVVAGKETEIPLTIRHSEKQIEVIGNMDAEQLFLREGAEAQQSLLSATGRGYFVVVVMGEKDEPSVHARGDLSRVKFAKADGSAVPVVILGADGNVLSASARPQVKDAIWGADVDNKVQDMLAKGCNRTAWKLPVVAVCDTFGRTVYFSQGYNISLAGDLERILGQL